MTNLAYTYDELDEIFRGDGRSDGIGMSAIDGLIAALVAGPVFVPPQEWLPLIFAGGLPAAVDDTLEHLAVNTIFNRYNEVSTTLAENPQAYRPIFMHHAGRVILSHWAVGFIRGIGRRPDAWTAILRTGSRKILAPIFVSHKSEQFSCPMSRRPKGSTCEPARITTLRTPSSLCATSAVRTARQRSLPPRAVHLATFGGDPSKARRGAKISLTVKTTSRVSQLTRRL